VAFQARRLGRIDVEPHTKVEKPTQNNAEVETGEPTLTQMFHTGFLRMGRTGYQPVLVGNLPTRLRRALCRDDDGATWEAWCRGSAGLV